MSRYAKPKSVQDALSLLAQDDWRIVAGGTDFYPAQGARPITENILDINGLSGLRAISRAPSHYVIGARTTWTDIVRADLPSVFDGLKQAAIELGSVQIQNVGSIGGNLCNASPAADGVPPLLVLDAEVEISAAAGARRIPLSAFILGNRKTALHAGEMVTAIHVPHLPAAATSAFRKLGARRYLVISIAMAAARVEMDASGAIVAAAIAVGSCSVVAQRLHGLETALAGLSLAEASRAVEECDLSVLSPIDDVRATASYRAAAARDIVRRVLIDAAGQQAAAAA